MSALADPNFKPLTTVGRLKAALSEYPLDAEVEIICYLEDGSAVFSAVTGISEGHKAPNLLQFFVGLEAKQGVRHV